MSSIHRISKTAFLGTLAIGILAAAPASAQQPIGTAMDPGTVTGGGEFTLGFDAGVAIPGSDLNDLTDAGFTAGVKGGWWLSNRMGLYVEGDVDFLQDQEDPATPLEELTIYHYGVGLQGLLWPSTQSAFNLLIHGSVGGSTMDAEGIDFTETYFSVTGGVTLGYAISPSIRLGVTGRAHVIFSDQEDTDELVVGSDVEQFDSSLTYPVTFSLDWVVN